MKSLTVIFNVVLVGVRIYARQQTVVHGKPQKLAQPVRQNFTLIVTAAFKLYLRHRNIANTVKLNIAVIFSDAKRHIFRQKLAAAHFAAELEGICNLACNTRIYERRNNAVKMENSVFADAILNPVSAADTAFYRVGSFKHFIAVIAKIFFLINNSAARTASCGYKYLIYQTEQIVHSCCFPSKNGRALYNEVFFGRLPSFASKYYRRPPQQAVFLPL